MWPISKPQAILHTLGNKAETSTAIFEFWEVPKSADRDFEKLAGSGLPALWARIITHFDDKLKAAKTSGMRPATGRMERRPSFWGSALPVGSVDGGKDLRGFGMLQGVLPQPMEVPGEDFGPPILEGK